MSSIAGFHEPSIPSATVVGCFVASAALHLLLLLLVMAGDGGAKGVSTKGVGGELDVQLVDMSSSVAASNIGQLPARLERADFDPAPHYQKLLKFTPVDVPRAKFDESRYQPLSALTVPPTAAGEIVISYPHDPYRVGLLVAALTLFIDEDGAVAQVRIEEPRAPRDYERAAVEAFLKARFNPGRQGERPTKVRMTIRVAFESGGSGQSTSAGIRIQ